MARQNNTENPGGNQLTNEEAYYNQFNSGIRVENARKYTSPSNMMSTPVDSSWDKLKLTRAIDNISDDDTTIILSVFPGVARVSVDITWKYVVNKSQYGIRRVNPLGLELRTLDVELLLSVMRDKNGKSDFDKFCSMMTNSYFADLSKASIPFYIEHPQAEIFNIKMVNIISISAPAPNAKDGWTVKMKLQEYFSPDDSARMIQHAAAAQQGSRTTGGRTPPKSPPGKSKPRNGASGEW